MDAELIIYIVIILKVLRKPYVKKNKNYKQHLKIIIIKIFSFLLYCKKCVRVFFNIKTNKLFLFKESNYMLNLINNKKLLYNFFYNLL